MCTIDKKCINDEEKNICLLERGTLPWEWERLWRKRKNIILFAQKT
jgi:hypothetical protein